MKLIPRKQNNVWDPFSELETLQNEMNRLFNFSMARHPGEANVMSGNWAPAVDIHDCKEEILVKADIPGMNKDEMEITVENDVLMIKGEKKREVEVKEDSCVRSERFYGSFYRSIILPSGVDQTRVAANYKDGVLSIRLPKREEAKPKQIKVDIN